MRKIDYINNKKNIDEIKNEYSKIFINDNKKSLESTINNYLKCFNKEYKLNITFDFLLTCSFEELVDLQEKLLFWSNKWSSPIDNNNNDFNNLFIYNGVNQQKISRFFMTNFKLKICHYCDEQYISSFIDFQSDYLDYLDFLNNASIEELRLLDSITSKKANDLINYRKTHQINSSTTFPTKIDIETLKNEFANLSEIKTHNYYTLDHVLPQSKFPFFSLSLFNFVPSCYSCNSKFKKNKEFKLTNIKQVSPTSSQFDLDTKIKFTIFSEFNNPEIDKISLQNINDNFTLKISPNSENYVKEYLKLFKLNGRYLLYKEEIKKMINKRIKYPDTELTRISNIIGKTEKELKLDIFGEDLFGIETNTPLSKMKQDIAEYLNLK